MSTNEVIRDMAKSFFVNLGTNAPFAMGSVSFNKIGFAAIKVAQIWVYCRPDTLRAITPVVRQFVFRELESMGLSSEILETVPSVMTGKTTMFVDINESSPTKGKRKRGAAHRFSFEIKPEYANLFVWAGSKGTLKSQKETT